MVTAESATARPLFRDIMASEMVTIKVGADEQLYRVHELLLTHYSEYFRSALRSGMEENMTRTFTLNDIEPHIFDAFVHWLYGQDLPSTEYFSAYFPCDEELPQDLLMITLYAFADRFIVSKLDTFALECPIKVYTEFSTPNHASVVLAFQTLPTGCPVQNLLVDVYCRAGKEIMVGEDSVPHEELPPSFLWQVLRKYAANTDMDEYPLDAQKYLDQTGDKRRRGHGRAGPGEAEDQRLRRRD